MAAFLQHYPWHQLYPQQGPLIKSGQWLRWVKFLFSVLLCQILSYVLVILKFTE